MNNRDERRYQRLTSVQTFGQERAGDFPPGFKGAQLLSQLDQYLVDLNAAKAAQMPDRISKRPLLKALDTDCRNIARTARAIGLDDPSFAAPYQMPDKPGETPLLTHIDAMLARLEDQADDPADTLAAKAALRARFTSYEIAADFVQTLRQHSDALRAASRVNQGEIQGGVENTMRVGQILDAAGDTIQQFDAIVTNKYALEPEKLRAWRTASRIEKAPRRTRASAAGSAGTPSAAFPSA
ncbi:MAG: hypothetical protein JWQ90_3980 [Hydrocarboniphaga sp.]|uniref:hypothetical protein n=1 Tax=Hydrocarboniphaga sp. TaxID=2033016 RepID=UPI002609E55B|nr:hypothetical protein [Hydrocarboniphaga sp.]MDB5971530.1 hypothetical protein [Hydrocarboniphaga sp.]